MAPSKSRETDFKPKWDTSDPESNELAQEPGFAFPRTIELFQVDIEDLLFKLRTAQPDMTAK